MAPEDPVVWFEGGKSFVGTSRPELRADGEAPKRDVRLAPFGIMKYAVSNAEFQRFVGATGYRTDAEAFGWSFVFSGLLDQPGGERPEGLPWWQKVEGACWHAPIGPEQSFTLQVDHPVVHISWNDAAAYADWAGGRLLREAEWEFSARSGNNDIRYPWGDDEPNDDQIFCNIWQGDFPDHNSRHDGYYDTAPVGAFMPNRAGLFNMAGNVWEWTADAFRVRSAGKAARRRNDLARIENEKVLKGGSYLCHRSYCWRYRIAARSGRSHDTSAGHVGFRIGFDR